MGLLDFEQLDVEEEGGVRRDDASGATSAVSHVGWNGKGSSAATFDPADSLVPASNPPAGAEVRREWFVAVAGAVELVAFAVGPRRVIQPTGVMHGNDLAALRLCARAHDVVLSDELSHAVVLRVTAAGGQD